MSNKKKKYFHDTYFKKIIKLYEENRLEEAISEFQNYIEIYPNDLGGYVYYADTWIKLGNFEEAEKLLEMAVITDKTSQASKDEFLLIKIKLLCCQGKYQECLNLLNKNVAVFKRHDWGFFGTLIFLKKQLGILVPSDYQHFQEGYLWNQIDSYDEEAAISHIENHMPYDINDSTLQFVEDFPLRDIYFKLREMLPLETKLYDSIITNLYVFKYDSIGRVNGKLVNHLAVVTLKDSNDIITMHPYENKARRECINLTPENQDIPKAKRMSQIDKFNQRYGKKVDNN